MATDLEVPSKVDGHIAVELGKLEQVDPRQVWMNEAHDFTPWLLENADRLSDALGIDLELEAAEHAVGGYSLDLVGRDITNDAILIVENQLATTDHSHLGQALTYAAGTGASTIIWIATAFREEHRQALDWLNESTGEVAHFFGIELQLVKIGDSQRAPLFNVVVQPNNWQKQIRTVTRNLTYDALEAQADENGVRELYDYAVAAFEPLLQKRTTRSSIGFAGALDGSRKNVISLLPGESHEQDGLFYRLYKNRLAQLAELEPAEIERLVPQRHGDWTFDPSGHDPDWAGFEGFITSQEEVDRLAGALRPSS